jgi:hypothetical protein
MQTREYYENIITGERIQQLCDVYLGLHNDFDFNPVISKDKHKHTRLYEINNNINNPRFIFCYTDRLVELSEKILFFTNKFILITHNSDMNIKKCQHVDKILSCENLVYWYAQNVCYEHSKLHILPIGLANSMWKHGDLSFFNNLTTSSFMNKFKNIYFNFDISTNMEKRYDCYHNLKDKIEFLSFLDPYNNLQRLIEYKFGICPEGNGVDTHRLWECLYLKVVPIVINSDFVQILKKYNVPLVILNNWNELDETKLNYDEYNFDDDVFAKLSKFSCIQKQILEVSL